MATSGQLAKGGIGPAFPFTGPVVFHTGEMAPPTTTTGCCSVKLDGIKPPQSLATIALRLMNAA